jgi:16S rRNA (adenine1518-N6/adenine1519-N6)-dimethyltransferase
MIRAKKIFGQHFLNAPHIIEKIVAAIPQPTDEHVIIEVGPGKGVLTEKLLEKFSAQFYAVEIDDELSEYLLQHFPALTGKLIQQNILRADFKKITDKKIMVVGNFPYNISSQIVFKVIENRHQVTAMVGMFQKEMATRIVAPPGSKDYGIPSVFTAAWFNTQYLFDVGSSCFNPPPKVTSGVIKLERNNVEKLDCDETLFFRIVKAAFNQRRKMLRNSLSEFLHDKSLQKKNIFTKRPEQLGVAEFIEITKMLTSPPPPLHPDSYRE